MDPVETIPGAPDAGVLFLCDHASNALPAEYGGLGLPAGAFQRHIAYDIGAATVTRALAARFSAPAVLTAVSRLLIDPNRGADDPTLVMRISDGAIVPGNARIDAAEVERRRLRWWQPYRDAVRHTLDAMMASGRVPAIVSVHSFTPTWKGVSRPWDIGVAWDADPRLPVAFMAQMRARGDILVGDNEPYAGGLPGDTLDAHAGARGLASLLVELRQDHLATPAGCARWTDRMVSALTPALARPEMHRVECPAAPCIRP